MTDAKLADHEWWGWFWTTIEHAAFVALIVALAIEFAALKLAEPHKKAVEDSKDLQIAELNNETARLREQAAPRELTPSQRTEIAKLLSGYAGRDVVVSTHPIDIEAMRLASQIMKALDGAKIAYKDSRGSLAVPAQDMKFGVEVSAPSNEKDREFAQAIANALDVSTRGKLSVRFLPEWHPPYVVIFVGIKPIPETE